MIKNIDELEEIIRMTASDTGMAEDDELFELARQGMKARSQIGWPATGNAPPDDVHGVTVIGWGTNFMKYESHELLIAAAPADDGSIASIRCRPNGDVLINERPVGNDPQILQGLRDLIRSMLVTKDK